MKKYILIFCLLLTSHLCFAQKISWKNLPKDAYIEGQVILKLKPSVQNQISSRRVESIKDEVLRGVKYKKTKPVFDAKRKNVSNHVRLSEKKLREAQKKYAVDNIFQVDLSSEANMIQTLEYLNNHEAVEYAEPVYRNYPMFTPNDTHYASQYNLTITQTPAAWDIEQGSENVVIGIVDNEFIISHEDLVNKWYYNETERNGIDGVDDDMNGYVDDSLGYDFFGRDPDVAPNDTYYTGHGMFVAGMAGAETNNGKGIASIGNRCKLMPLALSGTYGNTMEAVIYAAENGCKIVNMSWGRTTYPSRYEQEMFNYLTEVYDVVFVAAAGNTNAYLDFFPATYDNVFAVTASNSSDTKASFSTRSHFIDIIAPGNALYGTWNTGYNASGSGTSYAAPFAAGAIGLIRSHFPHLSAIQSAELLRITADTNFYDNVSNAPFLEMLGYGRLNIYCALTQLGTTPVVRFHDLNYSSSTGKKIMPDSIVNIFMTFTNYFKNTENLQITLSTSSTYVTIEQNTFNIGALDSLSSISNSSTPFQIKFSSSTPLNHKAIFRVGFKDGSYVDYQYFYITYDEGEKPFPSTYDLNVNYFTVGLDADGRLGKTGTYSNPRGTGIKYKTTSILNEAGLILATDAFHVADPLRTTPGNQNNDFTLLDNAMLYEYEGIFASVHSRYEDYTRNENPIGVEVEQLFTIWYPTADTSYFLMEYDITNKSGSTIPILYAGLFADWQISGSTDHADWDSTNKFGYVYNHAQNFYVGIMPLNDLVDYYAINLTDIGETNNINLTDDFTDAEKFQSLSSNLLKTNAGSGSGGDVAHVLSTKIEHLENNQTQKVGFVIACGTSLAKLQEAMQRSRIYVRSIPSYWSKPTQLSVSSVGARNVALTWKDNSDDEAGFVIQRSTSPSFDVDLFEIQVDTPNLENFSDTSAMPNTTYYYRIKAKK
ncbi:MAG: hypothetical protein OHK0038_03710 [Flammeovirgaceae bacterium]